jgi:hypothetical protein
MAYSIPREVFLLLETAFNQDREKAEVFAKAIEGSIQAIEPTFRTPATRN